MMAASTVIAICRAAPDDCDGCSEKITESIPNITKIQGMNFQEKARTGRYGKHAVQGDGAEKAHGRYGRNGLIKPERDCATYLGRCSKNRVLVSKITHLVHVSARWQSSLPSLGAAWKILHRLHLQPNRSRRSKDWDAAHLTKDSLVIDG
jgi:hypothetical protein